MKYLIRKNPWPLWSQITLVFIIVTLIVTFSTGEVIRKAETKRLLDLTRSHLDKTFSAVSATILDSVITEDISFLETVVEQLTEIDKNINSLKIVNEENKTLINWHHHNKLHPNNLIPFEKNIFYEGETFGVFKIKWNANSVYADITQQVDHVRLITVYAMLVLALVFSIGIHLLVIRPLQIVDKRLTDHASGNTSDQGYFWAAKEFHRVDTTINQLQTLTTSKKALEKEISLRGKAETALILARDEAQNANRAKSQFLANMSHELRTPLNAIIGYSEMMQEEFQDEENNLNAIYVDDLENIRKSGRHLLSLISGILDLSKIEARKMELVLEEFSLRKLIMDVVDITDPLVKKNNNNLEVNINGDVDKMKADVTKVRQILFNLVSNATKFSHDGKINITAEKSRQSDVDGVSIDIIDTGIGISDSGMQDLFKPFTQVDLSSTRKYEGTGLGLVLSKQLCQLMGGMITVKSDHGKGTTFNIWLPLDVEDNPDHTREKRKVSRIFPNPDVLRLQNDFSGQERRKKVSTILIIDDDPDLRDMISRAFRNEGFNTEVAKDGPEGLELARKVKPQLITLDIMIPRIDGWAVLKELKADKKLASIPVIIVSIIENKILAHKLGAVDSLTKPVDWDQLMTAAQQAVRKKIPVKED